VEAIRLLEKMLDKLGGDVAAARSNTLGFIAAELYRDVGANTSWRFPLSMASWKRRLSAGRWQFSYPQVIGDGLHIRQYD